MSKLKNMRERVHQPFYDHLVRGVGRSTISNNFQMFGSANIGNPALTNMKAPSTFPSDNTVIVKAIRAALYFQSTNDDEFAAFGNLAAVVNTTGDAARALDVYQLLSYGAYFTFTVGEKPMINAPLWYIPQGGGVAGVTTNSGRNIATNGVASHEAILKLAKDIQVSARQNIGVQINFFPFPVLGTGAGGGTITPSGGVSPLDYLNEFDGLKSVSVILDSLLTRIKSFVRTVAASRLAA